MLHLISISLSAVTHLILGRDDNTGSAGDYVCRAESIGILVRTRSTFPAAFPNPARARGATATGPRGLRHPAVSRRFLLRLQIILTNNILH